jgi:long-chain acyl-CoA synthetase
LIQDESGRPCVRSRSTSPSGSISQTYDSGLAMFRAARARVPDSIVVRYFDGALTAAGLDDESDAFAAALAARGFGRGDRLALYMQNTPQFVVAVLAAWKLGGTAVPVNPMNKLDELRHVLLDAEPKVLLGDEGATVEAMVGASSDCDDLTIIVTSPLAYQSRDDSRVLPVDDAGKTLGLPTMAAEIESHRGTGIAWYEPSRADPAFITYTSGTTGRSKGAVNHHGAVAFSAQVYRDRIPLTENDRVLGLAPMSGITGLIVGLAISLMTGADYILHYRFNLPVVRDAILEHRPTFLCAPPTLFIALLNDPTLGAADLAPLTKMYCGAAPVPPALVAEWRGRFGSEIRTVYGLTEATGPTHLAPTGVEIPVDPESGALSIGVPVDGTQTRVVDADGVDVLPGQLGELLVRGPQIVLGYWRAPDATGHAVRDGWLHTGDLVKVDENGWFYLVERMKDIIIASGYNVIPREVEDMLYQHPAVLEAAVVGVPHPYRGETVKAFVTVRPGHVVTAEDLLAFARAHLSRYKCPTEIDLVDALPKNANGKILKRELRSAAS